MSDRTNRQVGGTHYEELGMQPFYFATVNRYDPTLFSVLKYLSRFDKKNGAVDLDKAVHCIHIRETFKHSYLSHRVSDVVKMLWIYVVDRKRFSDKPIPMWEYVSSNKILDPVRVEAFMALEAYGDKHMKAALLIERIERVKDKYYAGENSV